MVAPVRSVRRLVYTFKNDGTGVRTGYMLGCEVQVVPFKFVPTLDEARNVDWGWSSLEELGLEAEEFTWEFSDDLIELSFPDYEFSLSIEIDEAGSILIHDVRIPLNFFREE